jgi:hypothetical protein
MMQLEFISIILLKGLSKMMKNISQQTVFSWNLNWVLPKWKLRRSWLLTPLPWA